MRYVINLPSIGARSTRARTLSATTTIVLTILSQKCRVPMSSWRARRAFRSYSRTLAPSLRRIKWRRPKSAVLTTPTHDGDIRAPLRCYGYPGSGDGQLSALKEILYLSFINGVFGTYPRNPSRVSSYPRRRYVSTFLPRYPLFHHDISTQWLYVSPSLALTHKQALAFFPPRVSRASDVFATPSPGPGTQR